MVSRGCLTMAKKKNGVQYDDILVELVPRIVDSDPTLIKKKAKYWNYSVQQVREFLGRLPDAYKGEVSEQRYETEKAAVFKCADSPYNVVIGFKPAYHLLRISPDDTRTSFTGKDCIACPTFDLAFKPADEEGTRKILQAGLDQFFLLRGDIEEGTLAVAGIKGKKVVHRDLELLAKFLPRGTVINARCNYADNGKATYRL